MNASGASLSLITTDIYAFFQLIQESYEKLSKDNNNLSYNDFYSILNMDSKDPGSKEIARLRTSNEVASIRKKLSLEFCSVARRYIQVKALEESLNKEQIKGIKRILAGISILFVVVVISLLLGAYVSAKPYILAGKTVKGIQIMCIFAIILTIVFVLLNILIVNSRYQLKEADIVKKQIKTRFNIFHEFLFGAPTSQEFQKLLDLLSTLDEINEDPKKTDNVKNKLVRKYYKGKKYQENTNIKNNSSKMLLEKPFHVYLIIGDALHSIGLFTNVDDLNYILSPTFDMIIAVLWQRSILPVILNVHSGGTGMTRLALTESKSDPIRILQATNDILSNHYKLMLKTYQSPDDNISKDTILNVIDNTVVKELKRLDFYDNGKTYSNNVIVEKLQNSLYYSLLEAGCKHLLIYMYLPWKVVDYQQLMVYSMPTSSISKSFQVTLEDNDKTYLKNFISNDATAIDIRDLYPLYRSNYVDELSLMEIYATSVSTNTEKQLVDKFISSSVSTFSDIYDKYNSSYMKNIENASISAKDNSFRSYISNFNVYFEKLFNDVLDLELMKLNPSNEQLFVFDTNFMREMIENIIDNNSALKQTEPKYRFYMTDAIINIIVDEQKKRFIKKYVDYNAEGTTPNMVKSKYITNKVNEATKILAASISPYQIAVADYNNYIYKNVFEGELQNPYLVSVIDNILLQIDFEASLIRKMKPTLVGDDEDKFVMPQNFVSSIGTYKFSTLVQSLRVNDLQDVVKALAFDQTGMFLEKEKSVTKAKLMLTGAILVSIFGYVVYMTLVHSSIPNMEQIKELASTIKPVQEIKQLDNEKLKSANTVIIREIMVSGVPFAMIVLFIAIFTSFVEKRQTDLKFNKERIEYNTTSIKNNITELQKLITELESKIKIDDKNKPIKDISSLTDDDKLKMYKLMKNILSSYDKCNYIIGTNRSVLPFPYAEVFADGLIIGVIICVIAYILFRFAPLERLLELKELYEYKETAETLVNDQTFIKEIATKYSCHTDNVESIMMTVKLLFATSIIVFMFLYTTRVVNSTKLYNIGIYNSKYFQKSQCC